MQAEKTRHMRASVISVLLAVLMIVTCIPSAFFASAAENAKASGPLVLTNSSIEFRDSKYNPIPDPEKGKEGVESGDLFYLMATISGNNVNEGEEDTYRIEITDQNLLLPNFAGNGFRDGAVYNGYVLHVNPDGSRYITFSIDNGQTKQIRLQAKFRNGKTPNGTVAEVRISQDGSGKSVSNTITAIAAMNWNASKSEDRTSLKASDIAGGTSVNYTLSASSNNASQKKGAEWVKSLTFQDTISLENMTFLDDDAADAIRNAVKSAIQAAGYDAEPTVTVKGAKADISFVLNSKNENAEMPAVRLNVALPLNSSTVKMNGTADGKVTNDLSVSGKPYGDNAAEKSIGGNSVELTVSAPKGPQFSLSKTVENEKAYYLKGDKVKFVITVTNTGDMDGDIDITDTLPDGLTPTGDIAWTGIAVPAGKSVTKEIECTVDKDETVALTNTVTGNHGEKAEKTIQVKKDEAVIETPVKSGSVIYNGKNLGQKYYTDISGQTATYTISVTNSGAKDAKDVAVSDANLLQYLENMTYKVDGAAVADFPGKIDVPAGKTVQITVIGTIKDSVNGEISNIAKVDGKSSNEVKFTPDTPKAQLGITKTVDKSSYVAGNTLIYTIVVENSGSADANDVTFSDAVPEVLESVAAKTDKAGYEVKVRGNTVENKGVWSIAPGEKVTVTITGKVKTGTTGEIVNQAQCRYDGSTVKSNEVKTTKDTSGDYKAEKWIVDENGNVLVDTDDSIKSGFQGFSEGDKAVFRVRFTNLTGATVNGLKMADGWYRQTSEDARTTGKVIACTGTYTGSTDLGIYYWYNDANKNTTWGYKIPADQLTLAPGQSIEIEYTMTMNNMSMAGARPNYYRNYVAFYPNNTWNSESGMWGATTGSYAAASVQVPYDFCFNTEKSASPNKKEISDLSQNDLENQEFTNTITLKPNTQDTTDYYGKTFTLTDVLPDGMTLADGDLSQVISVTNGTLDTSASKLDGNQLTIAFTSATSLNGSSSAVTITYKTKLTSDGAQKLYDTIAKSTTLTNTVTNVVVKDGETVLKDKTPNATADISFTKTTPAPGFAKLAVASFAGQTYNADDVQPVENGYITAGDTLIWQTVLYNGRGDSTDVADLKLDGVTLTDNLPPTYQFSNETGLQMTYQELTLTHNSDGSSTFKANDKTGLLESGTPVPRDAYKIDGSKLIIYADKLGKATLAPNKCIVFQFTTTVKDGQEKEGVITNTGYASVTQPFSTEDTVAGEKRDDQIWSYTNYNIVGLTTESWKTITYTNQNHTGTPHTDPATDTGYSRQPTHNYVQGMQGEDVTYELHIKNNSPVDLENMTIIDRLPYVGDLGLVSGYERFSAFGVKLKSIDSVVVNGTDVIDKTVRSYSTDKTSVLDEYSKDWLGQNDVMNWTNIKSDDTVDFRIQLQDTTVKVGEEAVVKVTATVPSYVAKTGEENIAWNSFAYSYQNTSILGDTVMVAEPAKVGVWVQTPDTTIDVTVNKTLTEAETKDATFYFALFADENYTTRLSDVISVTVPAGQTAASVTMKDVDLSSIKQQNNANNVYLLETDAKGNRIQNYTPKYTDNVVSP